METPPTSQVQGNPSPTQPPTSKLVQDPPRSHMVAPNKLPKKAYIRVMRPIRLSDNRTLIENQVAEVSEKDAKEFADRKFDNAYPYAGERQTKAHDAGKGVIVRAVRISKEEYEQALSPPPAEEEEVSA